MTTSTPGNAASASAARSRRARLAAAAQPVSAGPQTSSVAQGVHAAADAAVTLASAELRLDVVPHLGGGIARFDWRGDGAATPIFRGCDHVDAGTDPNALGCYPLLPYSNRIGGGRFECEGRRVEVPRNRQAEPLPIHGDGWLARWHLDEVSPTALQLSLDRRGGAPYAYRATQSYALDGATLTIALAIENCGAERLPFGLGLHPFIVREAGTELAAAANGLWLSGADWLPRRHVMVPPAWQFGIAYPLPATLVNHAFTGWGGRASVAWPSRGLTLGIESDAGCYVLYTPPGESFFCFEPVDHPINAVNLPGGAEQHGMTLLGPGARLARRFRFTVERAQVRRLAGSRGGSG
ncbi:aldose 1-epimerase [Burkholderia glumae]|uniref:Aldose 1-epimerase n=1 Tax=Burkholderia glumae TaxID=337 RepID=A0AAQ0BSM4_BURGL|nr:aldose 1-epimerase [Burkholderia glumae]ACR27720.1 Aldose 1-epimerase [Burkholderia glumae BGR1]AJY67391.1 aldose 1-epimerase family protein [Burkholderia glumae LMG 2196 = ATCC 33617]MCM2481300.1 aldose 1-epimerase [Burkholderia glumae]MCM2492019.1 aldose 1-epimerase [Burkholderia glumae]MCM2508560.1 aldose 1-epimerase [Burkholderia glumae]